jgi:hypothetical protein
VNSLENELSPGTGGAWEGDDLLDDGELTQSLRTIRTVERERRVAEHQKAIQQREQIRKAKAQKANFLATKIS